MSKNIHEDVQEVKTRLLMLGEKNIDETVVHEILKSCGPDYKLDKIINMITGNSDISIQLYPACDQAGTSVVKKHCELQHNTEMYEHNMENIQHSTSEDIYVENSDDLTDSDDDRDDYYAFTNLDDISFIDTVARSPPSPIHHQQLYVDEPVLNHNNETIGHFSESVFLEENNNDPNNNLDSVQMLQELQNNSSNVNSDKKDSIVHTCIKLDEQPESPKPGCSKDSQDTFTSYEDPKLHTEVEQIHSLLPKFSYDDIYKILTFNRNALNRIELTLWDLLPQERPKVKLSSKRKHSDDICRPMESKMLISKISKNNIETLKHDIHSNPKKIESVSKEVYRTCKMKRPITEEIMILDDSDDTDTDQQYTASVAKAKLSKVDKLNNNINKCNIPNKPISSEVDSKNQEMQITENIINKTEISDIHSKTGSQNFKLRPAKLSVISNTIAPYKHPILLRKPTPILSPPKLKYIEKNEKESSTRSTGVLIGESSKTGWSKQNTNEHNSLPIEGEKKQNNNERTSSPIEGEKKQKTKKYVWLEEDDEKEKRILKNCRHISCSVLSSQSKQKEDIIPQSTSIEGGRLINLMRNEFSCNSRSTGNNNLTSSSKSFFKENDGSNMFSERDLHSLFTYERLKAKHTAELKEELPRRLNLYPSHHSKLMKDRMMKSCINAKVPASKLKVSTDYIQQNNFITMTANISNNNMSEPNNAWNMTYANVVKKVVMEKTKKQHNTNANDKKIILLNRKAFQIYNRLILMFPSIDTMRIKLLCQDYIKDDTLQLDDAVLLQNLTHQLLDGQSSDVGSSEIPNVLDINEQYASLLDIFPEADPVYLRKIAEEKYNNPDEIKLFVQSKLENPDYPTREEYLAKKKITEQQKQYTTDFEVQQFLDIFPDPFSYFENKERLCQFNVHALDFLKQHFNQVEVNYLLHMYTEQKYNLSLTVKALEKSNPGLKVKQNYSLMQIENIPILQECAFIQHKAELQKYLTELKEREEKEFNEYKARNELIECQCCFDNECMPSKCFECEAGHVFCSSCIAKSTDIKLANSETRVYCLSNCDNEFDLSVLQQILSRTKFSILLQKRQEAEIIAAGIDGLVSCPFCHFASIPPPEDKVFKCFNPDCMKESCRLCKEINHIPLKCDEKKSDSARLYLEEKMTEALVRTCYRCKRTFFKEDGCNKMTCTCGAQMCYICDKSGVDYNHFSGQGAVGSNLCPLWSDDRRMNAEAVIKVCQATMKQIKEKNPKIEINANALLPKLPPKINGPHNDIVNANLIPEHAERIVRNIP